MVEVDCFLVIGAHIETEMGWVVVEEVLEKFSSDSLTLATRSNSNSHKVTALGHLNIMLLL